MFKIEALVWVSFWRALKFQRFSWRVGSNPRRQSKNIEIWDTQLISNLCMKYTVHVSSTMWRIKNQASNSTSHSGNALRLAVLVAGKLDWGLQVMSSFSSLGLRFEGLFWERYILKGQIALEGHWKLQSWTLVSSPCSLWCTHVHVLISKLKVASRVNALETWSLSPANSSDETDHCQEL